MKTTNEIASDLCDGAGKILIMLLVSPLLLVAGIVYGPFWIAAKIYTTFRKEEDK